MRERPATGVFLEHKSSSALEIHWNVLYANATRVISLPTGTTASDVIVNRPGFEDVYFQKYAAIRASIGVARQFSSVRPPILLRSLSKYSDLPQLCALKFCPECARHGVHSVVFAIQFLEFCPVHGVPLMQWDVNRPMCREDYRLSIREPLVKEVDEHSRRIADKFVKAMNLTKSVEPMRGVSKEPSLFSFFVAGLMTDSGASERLVKEDSRIQTFNLTKVPKRMPKNTNLEEKLRSVYHQEVRKINATIKLYYWEHLSLDRIHKPFDCGICKAFELFNDSVNSPVSRLQFYCGCDEYLWPGLTELERWYLTPVFDRWIAPQAFLTSVDILAVRAVIQHEIKRLLYAHILHGWFTGSYMHHDLCRSKFVGCYERGWPGACVALASTRQLVLPSIRVSTIFSVHSDNYLLFEHP